MQFRELGLLGLTFLLIGSNPGWADQKPQQVVHIREETSDEALPSMELLEFLADWEDEGQWKGPEFFEQISVEDRDRSHGKTGDEKNGKSKEESNN
jgi:hypothetical protein